MGRTPQHDYCEEFRNSMRSFVFETDRALQHDLAGQAFQWSTTEVNPPILCLDLAIAESQTKRKRTLELKRVGPPSENDLPELQHTLSQYEGISGIVSVQLPALRAIVPIPLPNDSSRGNNGILQWPMVKWYLMFGSVVTQGGQTPTEFRERMINMVLGAELWCQFFHHEPLRCDCIGALELVGTLGTPPIGDYPWWWLEYPPFTQWYYDKYGRDPLDRFNELPERDPTIITIRKWLTSEVCVHTTYTKPPHQTCLSLIRNDTGLDYR